MLSPHYSIVFEAHVTKQQRTIKWKRHRSARSPANNNDNCSASGGWTFPTGHQRAPPHSLSLINFLRRDSVHATLLLTAHHCGTLRHSIVSTVFPVFRKFASAIDYGSTDQGSRGTSRDWLLRDPFVRVGNLWSARCCSAKITSRTAHWESVPLMDVLVEIPRYPFFGYSILERFVFSKFHQVFAVPFFRSFFALIRVRTLHWHYTFLFFHSFFHDHGRSTIIIVTWKPSYGIEDCNGSVCVETDSLTKDVKF